jgi:hypothetical protein
MTSRRRRVRAHGSRAARLPVKGRGPRRARTFVPPSAVLSRRGVRIFPALREVAW